MPRLPIYPARNAVDVITKNWCTRWSRRNKAVGVEYSAVNGGPLPPFAPSAKLSYREASSIRPSTMLSGMATPIICRTRYRCDNLKASARTCRIISNGVEYERIGDGPFVGTLRWDRLLLSMAQAASGTGCDGLSPLTGYITTKEDLPQPDLQLLARFIHRSRALVPRVQTSQRLYGAPRGATSEKPGRAKLVSANPADPR